MRGFQLRIFGLEYSAKRKTRSEKTSELILRIFRELRVFDLAERFRGFEQCFRGFYKAAIGLKNSEGLGKNKKSQRGNSGKGCKRG